MLKKLLKYEFLATRRTFGSLYLGLAGVVVLIGLLFRFGIRAAAISEENVGRLPAVLVAAATILVLVYVALLVAMLVMTMVTIIERFAKNLLGGEGYLMHTLPVSAQTLIASKMIVSAVWTLASGLAFLLSVTVLLALGLAGTPDVPLQWDDIAQGIAVLEKAAGLRLPVLLGGALLAGTAAILNEILCIYAAAMIGHQFKKYEVPAAIVAFLILVNLQSLLVGLAGLGGTAAVHVPGVAESIQGVLGELPASGQMIALWGGAVWAGITGVSVVFGAVYFCITEWLMKKHLNLQ